MPRELRVTVYKKQTAAISNAAVCIDSLEQNIRQPELISKRAEAGRLQMGSVQIEI
jgi:hypothetical protein